LRSSERSNEPLFFGEILAPAYCAFPLVNDLSILQDQFNVRGVLLFAFWAPHVRHPR
jgi:hypothetical protein